MIGVGVLVVAAHGIDLSTSRSFGILLLEVEVSRLCF